MIWSGIYSDILLDMLSGIRFYICSEFYLAPVGSSASGSGNTVLRSSGGPLHPELVEWDTVRAQIRSTSEGGKERASEEIQFVKIPKPSAGGENTYKTHVPSRISRAQPKLTRLLSRAHVPHLGTPSTGHRISFFSKKPFCYFQMS